VGRITKLAFVFIPLNFTTSFFGMNVTEFGTGKTRLWLTILVAVSMSIFTLIPMSRSIWKAIQAFRWGESSRPWPSETGELRENRASFRDFAIYTIKLSRSSLYVGFWFAVFWLFHSIHARWVITAFCCQGLHHCL